MSKIERMLQELCPDGVEYKKLGEVCEINRGVRVVRSQLTQEGDYPVYQNSLTPLGRYDNFNCEANTTFIIAAGAAGRIGFCKSPFWAADDCFYFKTQKSLDQRYIYYVLINNQDYFTQKVRKASVPRISRSIVEKFEIPVPPLPIQEEIVRILDHFTALTAELQAELQARQEQYEHYRNKLLTFSILPPPTTSTEVRWMKMSDLFEIRNGYTPSKANTAYWENGTIPWFRMEDIRQKGRILSDSIQHITPAAVKGGRLFPANSFIIATTATIGEHALVIVDSLANQRFTNLQVRKSLSDKIVVKFLYYYMFIVGEWCKNNTNVSGFASVDMSKFKKLLIPIPSISEQQRIVAILDKFDTLVNDLSQGLPAEIAAVQEQYEYYRNKLLTFKRIA